MIFFLYLIIKEKGKTLVFINLFFFCLYTEDGTKQHTHKEKVHMYSSYYFFVFFFFFFFLRLKTRQYLSQEKNLVNLYYFSTWREVNIHKISPNEELFFPNQIKGLDYQPKLSTVEDGICYYFH